MFTIIKGKLEWDEKEQKALAKFTKETGSLEDSVKPIPKAQQLIIMGKGGSAEDEEVEEDEDEAEDDDLDEVEDLDEEDDTDDEESEDDDEEEEDDEE